MQESGPTPESPGVGQETAVDANQTQLTVASPDGNATIRIYGPSTGGTLLCGEILSAVIQRRQSLRSLRETEPELERITHPFSIVVSQDCDLKQDFEARQAAKPATLLNVLLCQVATAEELRAIASAGSDIWKRIRQNKDERFQFLQAVPASLDSDNKGLPDLGIDFRRYFSIPTDELYEQFSLGAKRRCRLISPYKEHLMSRFAYFMLRVALPLDHFRG